jgi:hypothetical protein
MIRQAEMNTHPSVTAIEHFMDVIHIYPSSKKLAMTTEDEEA